MNEWTEEHKNVLREMWGRGIPAIDIGFEIGRSKNAVLGMAHRLGLPKHAYTMKQKKPREVARKPVPIKVKAKEALPPQDVPPIVFTSSGVSFLEVRDSQCHAIIGRDDDRFSLVRYCGNPVKGDESYCPFHCSVFFNPRVR
jgi:GcrA cell cycle regulator